MFYLLNFFSNCLLYLQGASLLTIRAADGDRGVSNSITFKIINGEQ